MLQSGLADQRGAERGAEPGVGALGPQSLLQDSRQPRKQCRYQSRPSNSTFGCFNSGNGAENVSSLLQTRSSSRPTGWRTVAGPSPVTRLPPPPRRADPRLPAAAAAVLPQVRMPWAWLRPPSPAPPAPPLPRPVRNSPAAATAAAAAPPPPSPAPSRFQLGKRRRVAQLQSEKILCLLQNHPHLY